MTNDRESKPSFPVYEISKLAEKESWRKEVNRPIYHIHKWWAQRLGSVFRAMLLYLMLSNDDHTDVWQDFYHTHDFKQYTVLDPFMGSGTTVGETLKLGANAIGCDINPISTFMVRQGLSKVSMTALFETYKKLEEDVSQEILDYYKTYDPDTGHEIPVLYYFWVKIVTTPSGEDIPLFSKYIFAQNAYPSKKPEVQIVCPKCWQIFKGKYSDTVSVCPHCNHEFNPQIGPASNTTVIDSVGKKHKIKDLVPKEGLLKERMYAILAIDDEGNKKYLPIRQCDIELYQKAQEELHFANLPLPHYEVRAGHNTDQARGYNYLNWQDFFNARQLLCLGKLLECIMQISDNALQEQMLCLFSSTLEYNNTFCSFKGEGTGAVRPIFSNHILKPERTPLENSVWGYTKSSGCFSTLFKTRLLKAKEYLDKPFELKIDQNSHSCEKVVASKPLHAIMCDSWNELSKLNHAALIMNGDSSTLPIPDGAIDFVVTDPPYFDFIHYSELSDFFYAWLSPVLKDKYTYFNKCTSGRDNEVQQTDAAEFSRLLGNVFAECYRVLKPAGKLAFSFHHSRASGWIAIASAIRKAGFCIDECFPLHAELMASTPKANAKEPISLDAMIICSKQNRVFTQANAVISATEYVREMKEHGKRLSKADVFVICASQSLGLLVTEDRSFDEKVQLIQDIYQAVLLENTLSNCIEQENFTQ